MKKTVWALFLILIQPVSADDFLQNHTDALLFTLLFLSSLFIVVFIWLMYFADQRRTGRVFKYGFANDDHTRGRGKPLFSNIVMLNEESIQYLYGHEWLTEEEILQKKTQRSDD